MAENLPVMKTEHKLILITSHYAWTLEMSAIQRSRKFQNKGISTVLTTLIIVVASVVLGTTMTLFGSNLFQAGAQQQTALVSNTHLWYQYNGTTPNVEGALVVRNTGDKDVVIESIAVRGSQIPFTNWAASSSPLTISQIDTEFVWQPNIPASGTYDLDGKGTNVGLTTQSGSVSVGSGRSVVIYFSLPANSVITSADIAGSVSITVRAGQVNSVNNVFVDTA